MSENIIKKELPLAFGPRYKSYALSVITDRALPDCRTGLKPSGRKIINDMYGQNLKSTSPEKKCAKVVGNVLGTVYPHGDSALYDALVRLGQPWNMRYPLIQTSTNFGSRDGDPAAAYRYTTCRLTRLGDAMCKDIEKDTVDMMDNFDGTLKEPVRLPNLWPNLLANGTNGIAVSMATNIAPHNLTELYDAVIYMVNCAVNGEEYEPKDLARFIKGPDFPDGGIIINNKDWLKVIETGKGKVITKAKYEIVEDKKNTKIIITELPYQVNKLKLVNKIDELRVDNKIEGIKEVIDATGRGEACCVEITLKKGVDPRLVEKHLLAKTEMKTSFNYNIRVLINNFPHEVGIMEALEEFIVHAMEVVRRRSTFDYNKINKQVHLLEGLEIALANIDDVIKTIQTEDNHKEILKEKYEFSEEQINHVLDMKLSKLSKTSIEKLERDKQDLVAQLEPLQAIIEDDIAALTKVREEFEEGKKTFGDKRRTAIEYEDEIEYEDLIKDEDLIITITSEGNIKSVPTKEYCVQGRAGKGNKGATVKDDEIITDLFMVNSKDDLLFITNTGRCHTIKAYKIPKTTRTGKGKNIVNYMSLEEGEYPIRTLATTLSDNDKCITMVTDKGQIKRIELKQLSTKFSVTKIIKLIEGHQIADAILTSNEDELMIATAQGMSVRFKASAVRPSGRSSQGVKGIRLAEEDYVIGMTEIVENCEIVTVTQLGIAKATNETEFAAKSRGCKGIKCHKLSDKTGVIVSCFILNQDDLLVGTADSKIIRISANNVARSGRTTTGTKLIKLAKGDAVVAAACLPAEDLEEGEE